MNATVESSHGENQKYHFCGFFSYKRGAGADDWYEESKNQLEGYIQTALGETQIPMFFDCESIPSGSYWRDFIRVALDRSPFLVAFLSPAYFNSAWCRREMDTFRERERVLGLRPGTLIHAVSVQGPEVYDQLDRDVQAIDFHRHYVTHPTFWSTSRAADYSADLRAFAARIVGAYQHTGIPPYAVNFPKLEEPDTTSPSGSDSLFAPMGQIVQPFAGRRQA